MQEILVAVKDWPVILQGAIGSGAFWLFLFAGQKIIQILNEKYSLYSKNDRRSWLINRAAMIGMRLSRGARDQSDYASILIYRSSRFLFRALMWLTLGFALANIIEPLSIIGFAGCLYYLAKGLYVVNGTVESDEALKVELGCIHEELSSLDGSGK